jgi:YgiT-type zinc finger domain-containing protein
MNCLICRQAQTIDGFTVIILERGELRYVIKNVPARICPACGDATVVEAVADRMLDAVESKFEAGQWTETGDFDVL